MARGKQIIKIIDKSIEECLTIFLKSCRVKNLSPKTISTYEFMCNSFVQWYGADKSYRSLECLLRGVIVG
jgi:hypothetical protein